MPAEDDSRAGPFTVTTSVLERIGAGRAITAASNGTTTVVATASGVHVVGIDDTISLPVTNPGAVTRVAIAPDGGAVLVTWPEATELWSLHEGDPALLAQEQQVTAAGFVDAGQATLLSPSLVRVLDASDGSLLHELAPNDGTTFRSLAIDPTRSTWFAAMSADGDVGSAPPAAVVGAADRAPTVVPLDLPGSFVVQRSVVGPSGHHLAFAGVDRSVGADDRIVLWDANLRTTTGSVAASSYDMWDVGADGTLLIAGDPTSRLIRPDGTETSVAVSSGASDGLLALPTGVHALPEGGFVTVWRDGGHTIHDEAGRVSRRDDGTGKTVLDSRGSIGWAGLTTVDYDGHVRVLGPDGEPVREITDFVAPSVNAVAVSGDERLAVATSSGSVSITGTADPALVLAHPEGSVTAVAFSPDARHLLTGVGARRGPSSFDDTVSVWDLADGERLRTTGGGAENIAGCLRFENIVEYAPDGSFLVAASHDFTVDLIDTESGEVQRIFEPQGGPLRDLTVSPDGTQLATTTDDGGLRVWDIGSGALLGEHVSGIGGYFDIAYLGDGSTLVGIDATGQLSAIDSTTGDVRIAFESGASREAPLAVSPDGRLVAATEGATIRLWSAETGQLLADLGDQAGTVTASAFAPDSSALVTGAADGTVTVWGLEVTGGG